VGAGGVARRHVETLLGFDDVAVVAVADPSLDAARSLAALAGEAEIFDHVEALLEGAAVDVLYICVPPFAHGPPERAALAAGLPFFVEKAPVRRSGGGRGPSPKRCSRPGVVTATGYHWRNLDFLERARELVADRPPRLAAASWLDKVPPVGWWTKRDLSGGQTVEQATHLLDVLLDLVGPVDEVHAIGSSTRVRPFPTRTWTTSRAPSCASRAARSAP
jgi:predicted dehydrogenase